MAYNENYGLKYPKGEDFYNVEDFNGNFDKVADEFDSLKNNVQDKLNVKQNRFKYIVAAPGSNSFYKNSADHIFSGSTELNNFLTGIPEGGEVYFAPGEYSLSMTLFIRKPLKITGSAETVIKSGEVIFAIEGTSEEKLKNVIIENITLVKESNDDMQLVSVKNADALWFKNITFEANADNIDDVESFAVIRGIEYCTDIFVVNCIFWTNMVDMGIDKSRVFTVDMTMGANEQSKFTLIFMGNTMSTYCNVNFSSKAGYNGIGQSGNLGFNLYVDGVESSETELTGMVE